MSTNEAYALPLSLGEHFRAARKRTGLDQDELGELMGVNRTTISRWERDLAVPPFDAIVALSRRSGWSLDLFARAIVPTDGDPEGGGGLLIASPGWSGRTAADATVIPFPSPAPVVEQAA